MKQNNIQNPFAQFAEKSESQDDQTNKKPSTRPADANILTGPTVVNKHKKKVRPEEKRRIEEEKRIAALKLQQREKDDFVEIQKSKKNQVNKDGKNQVPAQQYTKEQIDESYGNYNNQYTKEQNDEYYRNPNNGYTKEQNDEFYGTNTYQNNNYKKSYNKNYNQQYKTNEADVIATDKNSEKAGKLN